MEMEKKVENCGNEEIKILNLPNKICNSRCRICQCSFLEEIHQMKISGLQLNEIVLAIKKEFNYSVSESSLSRHFTNYFKIRDETTTKILKENLVPDSVKRASHTSAIIRIMDKYLELLETRFALGTIKVNISDLQKLMDIRYKILDSEDENDKPLAVIFENFFNKYKSDTAQGELNFNHPSVVLSSSNEPQIDENSQKRKEAEAVCI